MFLVRPIPVSSLIGLLAVGTAAANEQSVQRGEYLLHAGGCVSCHTDRDNNGEFMAGGRALETSFGTFYTPNITPDRETGIGAWSDEDFVRALHEGLSPEGENYYPAFPYTSFTGVTREDLLAMKAYLFSLPPISKPNRANDLPWYLSFRPALSVWKWLNFEPGVFQPDPNRSPDWNRGAYLVRHLGHCGECHTPRNWIGGLQHALALSGNPQGPEGDAVPNITPDKASGIGRWSNSDITYFLETGMMPDGDFAGSAMSEVIDDDTSKLTEKDRQAIAAYLKSLPPLPSAAK